MTPKEKILAIVEVMYFKLPSDDRNELFQSHSITMTMFWAYLKSMQTDELDKLFAGEKP